MIEHADDICIHLFFYAYYILIFTVYGYDILSPHVVQGLQPEFLTYVSLCNIERNQGW